MRKLIRKIYLKHYLKHNKGKAIDFGCGIGELLSILPQGSIGFEINEDSVVYCKRLGLNVKQYNPTVDNYEFHELREGEYSTFILTHVVEHIQNPEIVLRKILSSCHRLGIERIIISVPGIKGFRYDKTHVSFVDSSFIYEHILDECYGFALTKMVHFPINCVWMERYFTHHELFIVYDRQVSDNEG